jgi:hypothetical protein
MSTRPDKPREYFATLLAMPEEQINYSDIPLTTAADWENAEVFLPVTVEEFRAIKQFILRLREESAGQPMDQPTKG